MVEQWVGHHNLTYPSASLSPKGHTTLPGSTGQCVNSVLDCCADAVNTGMVRASTVYDSHKVKCEVSSGIAKECVNLTLLDNKNRPHTTNWMVLKLYRGDSDEKLMEMELLEKLAGEVLTSLIHVRIKSHVQETCNGSFGSSHIVDLESWLNTVMMGWLSRVYCDSDNHVSSQVMDKFRQKLLHLLYETYTRTLIDQIFNIIIEYPESSPAIEDLRVCVEKTDLRDDLVTNLRECMVTRLLHPGVNTPDVVTAYVAAIKTLRQLDPTGVLLETVTKPVRKYLRNRDDTVRCVVSSLTEDGPADLGDELVRGNAKDIDENSPTDEDIENWETWEPDPVDADPSNTSKSRRTSDIISMLVNVYGSKEVFVNEYRILLADRLLTQTSFDTDKEIRYLELLKLRFGESQMHYCEVMLKDLYDSKRINAHLLSEPTFQLDKLIVYSTFQEFPTSAKILSAQFWPPFKEETLELPPFVKEHLNLFTKAFETLKGNRTLSWKHHLGSVNLEIELKDRKLSMSVTPVQATIIWHFQDKMDLMPFKGLQVLSLLRPACLLSNILSPLRLVPENLAVFLSLGVNKISDKGDLDVSFSGALSREMVSGNDLDFLVMIWNYFPSIIAYFTGCMSLNWAHSMRLMFKGSWSNVTGLRCFLAVVKEQNRLAFQGTNAKRKKLLARM
ncbi:hypothetical protein PR048_002360 [Dryococelus australis]|uniref:Cullin family profile domain-containing protein n=1 Tax=Dryococelus australis TaxID=614101 RepID=A0ABQ9IK27_9NEOP|nr:hypothetical protein PR048_002360 [Dryococelus australis]